MDVMALIREPKGNDDSAHCYYCTLSTHEGVYAWKIEQYWAGSTTVNYNLGTYFNIIKKPDEYRVITSTSGSPEKYFNYSYYIEFFESDLTYKLKVN